ncbi:MAG: ArnT family glycosyltransferase [Bryobacteraceae bacterium]
MRLLLAALVAVNGYRAATQSITTDEAFAYNLYVANPLPEVVKIFDASHHVLQTLLVRASVAALGLSEFSVRLPTVLGGALFFFAVYRLCRRLFGRGWMFRAAVASVALNPFVLDFLSAARGYGLALGFWAWALDGMAAALEKPAEARMARIGVALGLAVAANLTFLIPVAAFALVFLLMIRRRPLALALPALLAAAVFLAVPLSYAERSKFYYGTASLWQSLAGLAEFAFRFYGPDPADANFYFGPFMARAVVFFEALAPAILLGAALGMRRDRMLMLFGGGALLTLAALVAAHYTAGMPYPEGRTGIYWMPLITLLGFVLARRMPAGFRAAGTTLGLLAAVHFALEFNVNYYAEWRFAAGARRIAREIRARDTGPVRIVSSMELEPPLNFYRQMWGVHWQQIDRRPVTDPGDYRVFVSHDRRLAEQMPVTVLYHHPLSRALLAK